MAAAARGMAAIEEDGGGPGHRDQRRPDCVRRAISGPLTPVTKGLSRSLADKPSRRSGHVTGPGGTDSQADSAGSIPVTRSASVHFIDSIRFTVQLVAAWCRLLAGMTSIRMFSLFVIVFSN
jgi:hypothetical protein